VKLILVVTVFIDGLHIFSVALCFTSKEYCIPECVEHKDFENRNITY